MPDADPGNATGSDEESDMDANIFDGLTRRTALRRVGTFGLGLGLASIAGGTAEGAKKKNKKSRTCKKNRAERNPCANRNWCVDRSQTCGPAGGFGKCLVGALGGNACAEILFQAKTCAECDAPVCTNCVCMLAAGGGDRCNNGANGFDYICARPV